MMLDQSHRRFGGAGVGSFQFALLDRVRGGRRGAADGIGRAEIVVALLGEPGARRESPTTCELADQFPSWRTVPSLGDLDRARGLEDQRTRRPCRCTDNLRRWPVCRWPPGENCRCAYIAPVRPATEKNPLPESARSSALPVVWTTPCERSIQGRSITGMVAGDRPRPPGDIQAIELAIGLVSAGGGVGDVVGQQVERFHAGRRPLAAMAVMGSMPA